MKKYLFLLFTLSVLHASAQNVTITPDGITPALSGSYPRLSYEGILSLPNPQSGDIAYDTTFLCLRVYNGTKWVCTYQNPSDHTPDMAAIITAGGTDWQQAHAVSLDNAGNIYITGIFQGTANFGAITKTAVGDPSDAFVAKYSNAGVLEWVQTIGGANAEVSVHDILVDTNNDVCITGSFYGNIAFDNISKASTGGFDVFVAKYNNAGVVQWVTTDGGNESEYSSSISVDPSNNLYISGNFSGTCVFGGIPKTSNGLNDIFIAKYSGSGTLQWFQTAGGTNTDVASDILVNSSGQVYITGFFGGTTSFGGISKTSAGGTDMFIAKYNPVSSSWMWVQTAGGTSNDYGKALTINNYGFPIVTGRFYGSMTFGSVIKTSAGGSDIFIISYSENGSFDRVTTAGGEFDDFAGAVVVDSDRNIYVTGFFQDLIKIGPYTRTTTSSNDYEIFVVKFNPLGKVIWLQSAGGISDDRGTDLALDSNGKLLITGFFSDTATFGSTSKTAIDSRDIFVARIQE